MQLADGSIRSCGNTTSLRLQLRCFSLWQVSTGVGRPPVWMSPFGHTAGPGPFWADHVFEGLQADLLGWFCCTKVCIVFDALNAAEIKFDSPSMSLLVSKATLFDQL